MVATYAEKWMIFPKARTNFHSDRDKFLPYCRWCNIGLHLFYVRKEVSTEPELRAGFNRGGFVWKMEDPTALVYQ